MMKKTLAAASAYTCGCIGLRSRKCKLTEPQVYRMRPTINLTSSFLEGIRCGTFNKEKAPKLLNFRALAAVRTGLEPVTPCVTGMYSNQLN